MSTLVNVSPSVERPAMAVRDSWLDRASFHRGMQYGGSGPGRATLDSWFRKAEHKGNKRVVESMQTSPARSERLAALRAEVRAIESAGSARSEAFLPFGIEAIDRRLAGGG